MHLGLSIEALIEKRKEKTLALKKRAKEKQKQQKTMPEEKEAAQEGYFKELPAPIKKRRLSRQERISILDQAFEASPEKIEGLKEQELKDLLKLAVKTLNEAPYEPVKIADFPKDKDPNAHPRKKRFSTSGSNKEESELPARHNYPKQEHSSRNRSRERSSSVLHRNRAK